MFSVITRSEAVNWLLVCFWAHIKIVILHCIVAKITTTATQHTGPFSLTMYWSSFLVGSLENSRHKDSMRRLLKCLSWARWTSVCWRLRTMEAFWDHVVVFNSPFSKFCVARWTSRSMIDGDMRWRARCRYSCLKTWQNTSVVHSVV